MDTHSVNISAAVEEVLALFQVQLMPISTGTPQELAFAESRVRTIKRMSTAMLAGAPHLDKKCWAMSDKYAVLIGDYLPQQSRLNHCAFYMRTGRNIDWDLIQLKVFGAPALYSDPNGPIHKRAPIVEKGFFVGYQWPAVLIKRETDGKVILVSKQKVRVHEGMYLHSLASQTNIAEIEGDLIEEESSAVAENTSFDNYGYDDQMGITLAQPEKVEAWKRIHDELKVSRDSSLSTLPIADNNMVQSIKMKKYRMHYSRISGQYYNYKYYTRSRIVIVL